MISVSTAIFLLLIKKKLSFYDDILTKYNLYLSDDPDIRAVFLTYFDFFVDGPIYLLNRRKKKVSPQINHVFFSEIPTIRCFVNIFLTANTDLFYTIYFSFFFIKMIPSFIYL